MLIIETGILWRLVAKRFEDRVNKAWTTGKCTITIEHRWLGLRLLLMAQISE